MKYEHKIEMPMIKDCIFSFLKPMISTPTVLTAIIFIVIFHLIYKFLFLLFLFVYFFFLSGLKIKTTLLLDKESMLH